MLATKGTWARECVLQAPASVLVSLAKGQGAWAALLEYSVAEYVALLLMGLFVVILGSFERKAAERLVWEEEVLKKEFGKRWEDYARQVPWRIVPGY